MDQKKLMMRVKNKAEGEKLTINSELYFIADTVVFTVSSLVSQKSSLMMAWLEGETLHMKALYEPAATINISKVVVKREKEAMLVMVSDNTIVVVSSKDPKGHAPQIIKSPAK